MEQDRHHRQKLLAGWGDSGQQRLRESSVLVVGVGALGSVSAEILLRAGVGRIVLVDRDIVERTNLQRQMLYAESDLGLPKVVAARQRLSAIDQAVAIEGHAAHLDGELARELVPKADVIIDGTDNFETRYVLNDASVAFGVPLVYGGAVGMTGTVMPVIPGVGPCLRCLSDQLPASMGTCDTVGVFGPVVATVGARQAAIALRLLLGTGAVAISLEAVDAWTGRHSSIDMSRAKIDGCACCAERRFDFLDEVATGGAAAMCGRDSVQVRPARTGVDLAELAARLAPHGDFAEGDGMLSGRFARELDENGAPVRLQLFADGRAIVTGVTDTDRAVTIYAKYVGA